MTWPQGWLPKIADLQIDLYSLMFTADEWARRVVTKRTCVEGLMKWKQGVAPQTATKFELNFSRPALASTESAGRHFLSRPPTVAAAGNSIITHRATFVK